MSEESLRADPPSITCVVLAGEATTADLQVTLDSITGQDYPAELVEIVVVDDEPAPAAAVRRGVERATGELVAFAQAGVTWLPHKLITHAWKFRLEPTVGLTHAPMLATDEDRNMIARQLPFGGRNEMLWGHGPTALTFNFIELSTLMVRAELLAQIPPIPEGDTWAWAPEWWLAAQVTKISNAAGWTEPCAYRPAVGPPEDIARRCADCVRDLLRRLGEQEADVAAILHVVRRMDALHAEAATGDWEVSDADRDAAAREAAVEGPAVRLLFATARAIGHDPTAEDLRRRLTALTSLFIGDPAKTIQTAAAAHGPRPFWLLAEADELVETPALLETLAQVTDADPVTVMIPVDGGRFDELVDALQEALAAHGLDGEDSPDLLAFPCVPLIAQWLPQTTAAGLLTATPQRGDIPCFGPADGARLRALIDASRTAVAA